MFLNPFRFIFSNPANPFEFSTEERLVMAGSLDPSLTSSSPPQHQQENVFENIKCLFNNPHPIKPPSHILLVPPATHICKSKMAVDIAQPTSSPQPTTQLSESARTRPTFTSSSEPSTSSSNTSYKLSSTASTSSQTSLASFRLSLPENPNLYDLSEISAATNNFLTKRFSSSSSTPSWRCTLRGRDAVVFQRKFRRRLETQELKNRLSMLCRSHHTSIVKLFGASVSCDNVFLVYEFVSNCASLAACLRNKNNPNFTVLSTWASRMQVAADLAQGLDYIHNNTGLNVP